MSERVTTRLSDYYDMLDRADWAYNYSDDNRVYRQGFAAMGRLQIISQQSDEHRKLYEDFNAWFWAEDRTRTPKPERPED